MSPLLPLGLTVRGSYPSSAVAVAKFFGFRGRIRSQSSRQPPECVDAIYIAAPYTAIIGSALVPRGEPAKLLVIQPVPRRTRDFAVAPTELQVQPIIELAQVGVFADQPLIGPRCVTAPTLCIRRCDSPEQGRGKQKEREGDILNVSDADQNGPTA